MLRAREHAPTPYSSLFLPYTQLWVYQRAWECIKKEHDIRFPEGQEHLHFKGDVCEDWMETTTSPKHFQHLQ